MINFQNKTAFKYNEIFIDYFQNILFLISK